MVGFLILESLLISSSITKIISDFAIKSGFLGKIAVLSADKLTDYLSFPVFIFLAFVFFIIGYLSNIRRAKGGLSQKDVLFEVAYLFCYLIIFLQSYFVFSSGRNLLIFIFVVYLSQLLLKKITLKKIFFEFKPRILLNGIIMGFFLSVLSSNLTKLTAVPLSLVVFTPFLYLYIYPKMISFLSNPLHLLFISLVFFPTNITLLFLLAVLVAVLAFISREYDMQKRGTKILGFLYIAAPVFIFTYNPLFYIGHFDSVEEGFWLAWIERLSGGQVLYRDFFVFHPPAITQGAYYFLKLFGYSIYNLRLYMHLLQVAGYFFIYLLINFFLKSKLNKILVFMSILILTHTYVRNNTVIRLGSGLIAFLPLFIYFKTGNLKLLLASGVLSALSFFVSSEVGLSTLLTLFIVSAVMFAQDPKSVRKITYPILGVILGSLPFLSELILRGSAIDFVKQVYYYSTSFSAVYATTIIERATREPMFIWQKIDGYFGSVGWYWEVTKISIIASFLAFFSKAVSRKSDYISKSSVVLGLFAGILTISFLGRSDYYHLLFVFIVSVILLIYLLEMVSKHLVLVDKIFLIVFLIYFLRGTGQSNFIQDNLNRFQAFANPLGNYSKLDLDRGGIYLTDTATSDNLKRLVIYLDQTTEKDEKIFVYPWSPEIYFLSQRKNATTFDTPLASFSNQYQKLMAEQLSENKPKYVVYNPEIKFLGLSVNSLPLVNDYLLENYKNEVDFGNFQVLSFGVK